ncbi:MAG: hypothetical protein HY565_05780 [Candidatus Kerfeldbacteria bacterium]|nr:hypothetical protein [Candidatus Kerfeldbacteria bacterium]
MPSRRDQFKSRVTPERQPGEHFFELASREQRRALPLIKHDPSFPKDTLPVPEYARSLIGAAAEQLDRSEDAPEVALRLILHFALRDPKKRAVIYDVLTKTPPAHWELRGAFKKALPPDYQMPEGFPPDYKPAWEAVRQLQPLHGIKVIDYGAAEGGFVRILRALGAHAYGIDREDKWPTWEERDFHKPYDLINERGEPIIVMGRERFQRPDVQEFLADADIFTSNRLLRVVNRTPEHRQVMDVVTDRILKPGGLVITTPAFYDERLDDAEHYGNRYSQFDYRGGDDGWDYSIARKLR